MKGLKALLVAMALAVVVASCGDPRIGLYVKNESSTPYLMRMGAGSEYVVVDPTAEGLAFEGPWTEAYPAEFTLLNPTTCSVVDRISLNAGFPHLLVVTDGRFTNAGDIDLSARPGVKSLREVPACPLPS